MEREKLRIDNGVKEIEVNDSGECIYIPIDDNAFFGRVKNFLGWVEKKQAALEKKLKSEAEADSEIADVISMQVELSKDMCAELDKLFGEGCCRKVFKGVQSPDIMLIWDFLEQIIPIIQKCAQERKDRISFKYNRNRKGAKSKR